VADLRHDGIAQPLDLVQAERGPALLFDTSEGEQRLDLWAAGGHQLALEDRIDLVRQLTKPWPTPMPARSPTGALGARSILVRPSDDGTAPNL
jgi:hypothetical protein